MADKYLNFAKTWKTVGVTSRLRWQQSNSLGRFNKYLLIRFIDRYGDKAMEMISETGLTIGLEDGKKICDNLNLDASSLRACLIPIEAVSLLSGVDSEIPSENIHGPNTMCLRVSECIYASLFDGMNMSSDFKLNACRSYSRGLTRAVSDKATVRVVKRKCAGDNHCEFVVSFG
jgi:hypothetical protein